MKIDSWLWYVIFYKFFNFFAFFFFFFNLLLVLNLDFFKLGFHSFINVGHEGSFIIIYNWKNPFVSNFFGFLL